MGVMAEQVDAIQNMFTQTDVNRALLDERLGQLADSVERLTVKLSEEKPAPEPAPPPATAPDIAPVLMPVLTRLADGQDRIITALEGQGEVGTHPDAESRMRLRSLDVQLLRILEEMQAGRQESLADIRGDLANLIHVIRVASGQDRV